MIDVIAPLATIVPAAEDLDVFVVPLSDQDPRSAAPDTKQQPKRSSAASGAADSSSSPGSSPAGERSTAAADATNGLKDPPSTPAAMDPGPKATYVKSRVEVGLKPLILRAAFDKDSPILGQLPPGVMMMVLEERRNAAGDVRARVSPIDEAEARLKLLDSWHHPFIGGIDELTSLVGLEAGTERSPVPSRTPQTAPAASERRPPASRPFQFMTPSRLPVQQEEEAQPASAPYAHAEPLSPQTWGSPGLSDAPLSPNSFALRPLMSQRAPTQRHPGGWVTIVKGGDELVRRRERLDAVKRQQHLQQWARRQRTDRSVAAQQASKVRCSATRIIDYPCFSWRAAPPHVARTFH